MFGALRRRPRLQVAHRSRGRVAFLAGLGLVIAIVIGEVTADVVNSAGPASVMSGRTYAVAVVPIIDESTALLPWLTDVRTHTLSLGRLGIESALGRLVTGSTDVQQQLVNLGVPAPSRRSAGLLSSVFSERTAGARAVAGGIALAIGPDPDAKGASADLLAAAADIQRSDADYRKFVGSLPGYITEVVGLPASQWYESGQWSSSGVAQFTTLLGSTPALRVRQSLLILAVDLSPPALRLTGLPTTTTTTTSTTTSTTSTSTTSTTTTTTTTLPGATTTSGVPVTSTSSTTTTSTTTTTTTLQIPPPGSVSWFQPTTQLSVQVVIANAGDVLASQVKVTASLTPIATSGRHRGASTGPAESVARVVPALSAGGSLDLLMPALRCKPGDGYRLLVRVGNDTESLTLRVAAA